jgi:4-alpha-glucanotransferase
MALAGPFERRRAGVLLHVTALPGPLARGVLGEDAIRFIDLLAAAGFSVWQTLPVGPVDQTLSPYQMKSAHAGDPGLVDPAPFVQRGWLAQMPAHAADGEWLTEAWAAFHRKANLSDRQEFDAYVQRNRGWLLPYAIFEHHRRQFARAPWWEWPVELRDREPRAMTRVLGEAREELRGIAFTQYAFDRQWQRIREHARSKGVLLFGDLPFYVDLDSVEVWWNRRLFCVDAHGRAEAVAGVPPDYFNADGQLWGNPLYNWDAMRADGFRWWVERVRGQLRRFDLLRVDHFRALESCWEIPAGAVSAREGRWQPTPGDELLGTLRQELGAVPLVAEDLGIITAEVRALRDRYGLPGMLVLQFAFDGSPQNPYLPANHVENAVVYTGTHDNDTTAGWYDNLDAGSRARVDSVLASTPGDMPGALIRAAYASPAQLAVLPMQDLLALGSEARMNVPGTTSGNWQWRLRWEQVDAQLAERCHRLAVMSGRA